MSTEAYKLEKTLWTDSDFEQMGWHDNLVHAIAFGPGGREFSLDIDYILKWEDPLPGEKYYRFWISPATLVFEDVMTLKINHDAYAGMIILGIERKEAGKPEFNFPKKLWNWKIETVEGKWELCASGYRQLIRRPPELLGQQRLTYEKRGDYVLSWPKTSN
jgi:hypothetical protein